VGKAGGEGGEEYLRSAENEKGTDPSVGGLHHYIP